LKSTFNPNTGLSNGVNNASLALVNALKKYGMLLADGGDIPLLGVDDTYSTVKYTDINFDSHSMFGIKPTDFDIIATDAPIVLTYDCVRNYYNITGHDTCATSGASSLSSSTSSSSSSASTSTSTSSSSSASSSPTSTSSTSSPATNSSPLININWNVWVLSILVGSFIIGY